MRDPALRTDTQLKYPLASEIVQLLAGVLSCHANQGYLSKDIRTSHEGEALGTPLDHNNQVMKRITQLNALVSPSE